MNFRLGWRAAFACVALMCGVVRAQPAPGDIQITPIITSGLSGPVGVTNAGDGSGRLFVIQQGGAIRVVRNNTLLTTPYLTLTAATQCSETVGGSLFPTGFALSSEQGLLGLAFHPQFETNGHFYVSYSGAAGDSIVARFTAAVPGADVVPAADQQTCLVVLRVDQDFSNHNGGNIVFGPGGLLYFGLGDGGSGNDPCNRGQTLNPADLPQFDGANSGCPSDLNFTAPGGGQPNRPTITRALLGKMLRIDVDGVTAPGVNGLCGARIDGGANYAVPQDNPYFGADALSGCDEVWIHGLRNPWRWSFDRSTNDLIIGDVGQSAWEEVNFFSAGAGGGSGANADWRTCEGRHVRGSCSNLCPAVATAEIIIAYNNGNSCASTPVTGTAVTGGYRYRGPDPSLQGVYFFGDSGRTNIYYSVESGGSWVAPGPATTIAGAAGGVVVAFGEDESGALYVIGGGNLRRIGAAVNPDVIFANGFE